MYDLLDAQLADRDDPRPRSSPPTARRSGDRDRGRSSSPARSAVRRAASSTVPVDVRTRVFGRVRATLALPGRQRPRALVGASLASPACARARRSAAAPCCRRARRSCSATARRWPRGPGRALAACPTSPANIAGQLGTPDAARAQAPARRRATRANALVGTTGLERVFERDLAGTPGGVLRAGRRVLARAPAQPRARRCARRSTPASSARPSRRSPAVSAASPRSTRAPARSSALAGIAFSGLQPPGSTFKIITAPARCATASPSRAASSRSQTAARSRASTWRTPTASRAAARSCDSFAHSCNSVFAPLGVEVGAKHLVQTAEAFGFNHPLGIPGARDEHDPVGRRHRRRPRRRLVGDRPGQGPGHGAADGARAARRSPAAGGARS